MVHHNHTQRRRRHFCQSDFWPVVPRIVAANAHDVEWLTGSRYLDRRRFILQDANPRLLQRRFDSRSQLLPF